MRTDDPFVEQILKESQELTQDPDRQQTYLLARLEGDSIEIATKRASRARASLDHTPSKDRGRRDHLGRPPVATDFSGEGYIGELQSLTQDNRTKEERQAEERREEFVEEILDILTTRERQVLTRMYGIGTNKPMTYQQIADELHMTKGNVAVTGTKARNKIRDYAGGNIETD